MKDKITFICICLWMLSTGIVLGRTPKFVWTSLIIGVPFGYLFNKIWKKL